MTTIEDNPLRDLNNARNLPRDTPETDAKASPHIGFYSCATVPADFARQLERQRNEDRDCGQEGVCANPPGCQRHWKERNRELVRERDAALDKIAELEGVICALRSFLRETSRETK